MDGGPGSDLFRGGRGSERMIDRGQSNDSFFGGRGPLDGVEWYGPGAVTADLAAGLAIGFGMDTLKGIENLSGWKGADTLLGNGRPNILEGTGGNDHLEGRGGNDYLNGSTGTDYLDGGTGSHDICDSGEVVLNCEGV
jgi:Ca2+-binding RTX toxin-like protein